MVSTCVRLDWKDGGFGEQIFGEELGREVVAPVAERSRCGILK